MDQEYTHNSKLESIILKYLKLNCHLLSVDCLMNNETNPIQYHFLKDMSSDLQGIGEGKSVGQLLLYIRNWITRVEEKFERHKNYNFSNEEIDLLLLLQLLNHKWVEPTITELNIILEYVEELDNTADTWICISSKIKDICDFEMPGNYWEMIYNIWIKRTQKKKSLFDLLVRNTPQIDIYKITSLEYKLLRIMETQPEQKHKTGIAVKAHNPQLLKLDSCRICLNSTHLCSPIFIENSNRNYDITLLEKISQCANVNISRNDGWPDKICNKCLHLVEKSFHFKVMCEKNDFEMKKLHTLQICKNKNQNLIETEFYESKETGCSDQYLEIKKGCDRLEEVMVVPFAEVNVVADDLSRNEIEAVPTMDSNILSSQLIKRRKNESLSRQCDTCGRVFGTTLKLKSHMKTHSNSKDHICDYCKKKFKTSLSLKVHLRCHTGERPYVCEVCGKRFSQTGALSGHRKIHRNEKNYPCNICNYRAITRQVLRIHERKHSGHKPHNCDLCCSKFSTASNLIKHKQRRHMGLKNFKKCGKAFKTVSAINNHRASHSIVKEFVCPLCPYRANTKATLKVHDRTHSGIQPYKCSICDAKFSTASNLLKHVRNIHEKIKLHKCDQCDRSFFSKESARKHMVTHSGIKPYTCKECSLTYSWYNGLQKHYRQQHPNSEPPKEKSFLDQFFSE